MFITLDNQSPKYLQIYNNLKTLIDEGELKPGDEIPSEREYAEALSVSRMTVRSAISNLVREGLLSRHQGRNTRVSSSKLDKNASGFMSFSEDMETRGLVPSSKVIRFSEEVADVTITSQLHIPTGSRTIVLQRIRFANEEPMALETVHLPYNRFHNLLSLDMSNRSLYQTLESQFNCHPESAEESMEAVLLSSNEADLLGVPKGNPALLTKRITRDSDGIVIEIGHCLYRADRYRVILSRMRR
jgi:GntR family transcriptional regulator